MSDAEESRTASLGRKRRRNGDPIPQTRGPGQSKRQKLDTDADFIALDSDDNSVSDDGSRESGEISTSAESSQSQRATEDSHHVSGSYNLNENAAEQPESGSAVPPIDLESLYPPALQKWVQEQMKQRGISSPETVLRETMQSQKRGQPYNKASKTFLLQWDEGFRKIFPDFTYNELQHAIETPNAFRQALDIAALKIKFPSRSKQKLLNHLQSSFERAPNETPASVLFGLIKDHKMHLAACRAMRAYVDEHLNPEFAPLNKSRITASSRNQDPATSKDSSGSLTENHHDAPAEHVQARQPSQSEDESSEDDSESGDDAQSSSSDAIVRLRNISLHDQALQYRYFCLSDPSAPVRCLSCAQDGHMHTSCPALSCTHCGSNTHISRQCPPHQKCERCRQRGHRGRTCTRPTKQPGAPGDECDICGKGGHAEEQCIGLWQTYFPEEGNVKKIPARDMSVACYNCGSEGHWGDDCYALPSFIKLDYDTWSAKNASRYIIGGENGGSRNGVTQNGGDGGIQRGGIQSHQLAQLGDWY